MKKPKILIVDDQDGFREELVGSPILKSKFQTFGAESGEKALDILKSQPDISCVLLDYDFHPIGSIKLMSGLDVLNETAKLFPHIPIIMMSGITEGRGSVAAESIKQNALGFLDKPFSIKSLLEKLDKIIQRENLADDSEQKKAQEILSGYGFISTSPEMGAFCLEVCTAASNDMNIMIVGDTGTGKTHLARIIHSLSNRNSKQYEEFHCGTISSDINSFRSQLFGHVKGAFSGAVLQKKGILELTGEGTIFFDDISVMPPEAQQGLLQAIESKVFTRFGDDKTKLQFGARIISSTNQNLKLLVQSGKLREDLKFRLCGEIIYIPRLNQHPDDIPQIVRNFLNKPDSLNCPVKKISEEAMTLLRRQPWDGNVRQLIHLVSRASSYEKTEEISVQIIRKELIKEYNLEEETTEVEKLLAKIEDTKDLEQTLKDLRKEIILKALKGHKGNVSESASALGFKNHQGLQYWIKEFGIEPVEFK